MDAMKPLRPLFVWAMLGYVAIDLLLTLLGWVTDPRYADFTKLTTLALPLVAVLIATHIQPALANSGLMTLIALIEYAAVLFFGALAFLFGIPSRLFIEHPNQIVPALSYLAYSVAELGIAALAGYAVYRVFRAQGNRLHLS